MLVEVPPEGDVQHQRHLAGGRTGGFEVVAGGTDCVSDMETIIAQGRCCEALPAVFAVVVVFWQRLRFGFPLLVLLLVLVLLGESVDDNRPAWRENRVVASQVVGLEVEAAKHGGHREGLPVGEMTGAVAHGSIL